MLKDRILNEMENNKIRQGFLLKRSKYLKEWRERWIVLTYNYLISFKSKDCKQITEVMELSSVQYYKSYVNTQDEMVPASFKIKSGDTLIYLCAKDSQQKWSWMVTFQRLFDYRVSGASKYNNLTYIKTMGFKSLIQFQDGKENMSVSKKSQQFQFNLPSKDQEALVMMKQIFRKQEQMKREKDLLRKQKKLLKKQIQQFQQVRSKNPQLFNSSSPASKLNKKISLPANFSSSSSFTTFPQELTSIKQIAAEQQNIQFTEIAKPNSMNTGTKNVSQFIPETYSQKKSEDHEEIRKLNIKQEIQVSSERQIIISGIFNEFLPNSEIYFGFRYFIDFLAELCSDDRIGYGQIIFNNIKRHKNKQHFTTIFLEIMQEYSYYKSFEYMSKFLFRLLKQTNCFLSEVRQLEIAKKVFQILYTVENDDKQELINLLKILELISQATKLQKKEQFILKLNKMSKMSKREETRELSKKILSICQS